MSAPENTSSPVCPVDDKTREAWLKQARAKAQAAGDAPPSHPHPLPHPAPSPLHAEGCDSSTLDQKPSTSVPGSGILASLRLGTQREVSSIPRAATDIATPAKSTHGLATPANSEADTGADKKTGNWIYPSEKMFFEAMKRKNYDPEVADMKTIIPIHNAVNERAWMEIKQWEKDRGGEACGGPRLTSFSGLSSSLTPRARFNTLLGYSAPFDRHDWVVDRCGTQVDYVIDFYAGRDEKKEGKELNFYLDVRPKLNSWEGVRMRVLKFWGL